MSVNAVVYKGNKIINILKVPNLETVKANVSAGEEYLITDAAAEIDNHCIVNNQLKEKSFMDLSWEFVAVGQALAIQGIPIDSEVVWPDGYISIETDGQVSTDAPYSGELKFSISHPCYYSEEVIVNVTP